MVHVLCARTEKPARWIPEAAQSSSTGGQTDRDLSHGYQRGVSSLHLCGEQGRAPVGMACFWERHLPGSVCLSTEPFMGKCLHSWGHQIHFVASSSCCKNVGRFSERSHHDAGGDSNWGPPKQEGIFLEGREDRFLLRSSDRPMNEAPPRALCQATHFPEEACAVYTPAPGELSSAHH